MTDRDGRTAETSRLKLSAVVTWILAAAAIVALLAFKPS